MLHLSYYLFSMLLFVERLSKRVKRLFHAESIGFNHTVAVKYHPRKHAINLGIRIHWSFLRIQGSFFLQKKCKGKKSVQFHIVFNCIESDHNTISLFPFRMIIVWHTIFSLKFFRVRQQFFCFFLKCYYIYQCNCPCYLAIVLLFVCLFTKKYNSFDFESL